MTDLDELERRIRATVRAIRRYCARNDFAIAADGAICEEAAAKVLGYTTGAGLGSAIRNGTIDLPYRLLGNARKYRVVDLATHIERSYRGGENRENSCIAF